MSDKTWRYDRSPELNEPRERKKVIADPPTVASDFTPEEVGEMAERYKDKAGNRLELLNHLSRTLAKDVPGRSYNDMKTLSLQIADRLYPEQPGWIYDRSPALTLEKPEALKISPGVVTAASRDTYTAQDEHSRRLVAVMKEALREQGFGFSEAIDREVYRLLATSDRDEFNTFIGSVMEKARIDFEYSQLQAKEEQEEEEPEQELEDPTGFYAISDSLEENHEEEEE